MPSPRERKPKSDHEKDSPEKQTPKKVKFSPAPEAVPSGEEDDDDDDRPPPPSRGGSKVRERSPRRTLNFNGLGKNPQWHRQLTGNQGLVTILKGPFPVMTLRKLNFQLLKNQALRVMTQTPMMMLTPREPFPMMMTPLWMKTSGRPRVLKPRCVQTLLLGLSHNFTVKTLT
jgi:hypothetical protein